MIITLANAPSDWVNITDGVNHITTITATVAAGVFGYYKFARGRIFQMRCDVELTARMVPVEAYKCAKLKVTFTNEGQSGVSLYTTKGKRNKLYVYELNELMLGDACASLDDVVWEGGIRRHATLFRTIDVTKPTIIEPGEHFSDSILVPLSDNAIGFHAVAVLQVKSKIATVTRTATYWAESTELPEEDNG